ncbi:MAG: class I SAM-dependent methyltransferase [Archangiaceae bacterium]|nr:class I SAM-dependent methyltransferase [Archangiaceae bacterium]
MSDQVQKAPSNARSQYSKWAAAYDADTASYGWSAPQTLLAALERYAPPRANERVLDVGIGTGQSSIAHSEAGGRVTGLDISPKMLDEARQSGQAFDRLATYDINQPLSTAGVQPRSMDTVLSVGTLHFAKDLAATLRELGSAVKPGGHLAFTSIPPQGRAFGPNTTLNPTADVKQTLRALGFTVLEQRTFVAYHDKGDPNDPVKYDLFVARKNVPMLGHSGVSTFEH